MTREDPGEPGDQRPGISPDHPPAEPPGAPGPRPLPGGSTQQLLVHEEDLDARLASNLNGIQSAGIHYRLSLTHCLLLETCLNCIA